MNFLNILTRILSFGDFKTLNKKITKSKINTTNGFYYDDKLRFHIMLGIIV